MNLEKSPVDLQKKCILIILQHYSGTSLLLPGHLVVWTAQISLVACSLLTIMKFGLDEKVAVCQLGGLFYYNYQMITHFYSPGEGP